MGKIRSEETQMPEDLLGEGYALSDSLAVRIDWLNAALERQTRIVLADEFALTPVEWRCLASLCVHGPKTGAELAEMTSVSPAQISRGLRRLRDDHLIAWSAGSEKRGFGAAFASEEGLALFAKVRPVMQARNLWLLGGLEDDEQEVIYRLIAKLRMRLAEMPGLDDLRSGPEYAALTDK